MKNEHYQSTAKAVVFAVIGTLITLLLCVLFSGCKTQKPAPSITQKVVYRDSIREVLRDTVIYIEIDKVVNSAIVLPTDTSRLESKFAKSSAWLADNILHHTLEQKPQQLPVQIKYVDKWHTSVRDSVVREVQVKMVEKELTRWQLFRLTLGNIFGGITLVSLLFGAFKLYSYLKK